VLLHVELGKSFGKRLDRRGTRERDSGLARTRTAGQNREAGDKQQAVECSRSVKILA
jgi:hypothetical protein